MTETAAKPATTLTRKDVAKMNKPASGDLLMEGDGLLSPRLISDGEPPAAVRIPWPGPTPEMFTSPEFEAVWLSIRKWDINVPDAYAGYCCATGNHVRAILDALASQSLSREAEIRREVIEECVKVAAWEAPNDCESLGMMDPETGQRECSLEVRGDSCLCAERYEEQARIVKRIRALAQQPDIQRDRLSRMGMMVGAAAALAAMTAPPQPVKCTIKEDEVAPKTSRQHRRWLERQARKQERRHRK